MINLDHHGRFALAFLPITLSVVSLQEGGISPGFECRQGLFGRGTRVSGRNVVRVALVAVVDLDVTGEDHAPIAAGPGGVDGGELGVGQVVADAELFGHGGFDEAVGEDEAGGEGEGLG